MNRKIAIFAALIAAFAFTCQSADARGHRVNKKITAVAIGVGAAATVTYFGIGGWKWGNGWDYSNGFTRLGAWGATSAACLGVSPIVATIVMQRPLKYREAHILAGSCLVPIVGGWLVNEAYNNGLIWAPDEKPMKHGKKHKKKMG